MDGNLYTPLGKIRYLFSNVSSLTVLVACREFRETENRSIVAYYEQTRYRYLLSTCKKLSCVSKQMAKKLTRVDD